MKSQVRTQSRTAGFSTFNFLEWSPAFFEIAKKESIFRSLIEVGHRWLPFLKDHPWQPLIYSVKYVLFFGFIPSLNSPIKRASRASALRVDGLSYLGPLLVTSWTSPTPLTWPSLSHSSRFSQRFDYQKRIP